jgi:DMSO reductase anchor subunit
MQDAGPRAATWKRVLAAILDFFTVFLGGGMLIAWATGDTTPEGFNLTGAPALLLFALIVAYFFIGRRYAGGTIWDRILRIQRPQPR